MYDYDDYDDDGCILGWVVERTGSGKELHIEGLGGS